MNEMRIVVSEDYDDIRMDVCISSLLSDKSRTYIQKLIKEGNVLLNEKKVNASTKVHAEDVIVLNIPDNKELDIKPENIPLDILYEDKDIIIVNKGKNMVVHPAPGHYEGTLVNALLYYCKDNLSGINGVLRPGIVHRIDKDTTGSLVVCKTNEAHMAMAERLKIHDIDRKYRAIVHGVFNDDKEGTIKTNIGRNPNDRLKMAINVPNGKEAITHYKVLSENNGYSYIECKLETGRTHQIRVHMASINHPILGDELYCNRKESMKLNGQTLHAYYLKFIHPISGIELETIAPLPEYFEKLLNNLNLA